MLESFFGNIEQFIHHSPLLALGAVFVGGLLTASNPCVLVSIPLVMAFVAGSENVGRPGPAFAFSFSFVLGLSLTFTLLAIIAVALGGIFGAVGPYWKYIIAAVCLIMGLDLLGLYHLNIPTPAVMKPHYKGVAGAFVLGVLFGLVSLPCAGPILIVLLTYLAAQENSMAFGAALLLVYALGHCTLILVAGTSAGAARKIISSKTSGNILGVLRKAAGGVVIMVGIYFLLKT